MLKYKENRQCVQTIFLDIREYFDISAFEKSGVDCTNITFLFVLTLVVQASSQVSGPEVIKLFLCSTQLSMKF